MLQLVKSQRRVGRYLRQQLLSTYTYAVSCARRLLPTACARCVLGRDMYANGFHWLQLCLSLLSSLLRPLSFPVPNTGMGGRSIEDVLGYNQDHRLPSPSMFCAGERRRYCEQFQFGRG